MAVGVLAVRGVRARRAGHVDMRPATACMCAIGSGGALVRFGYGLIDTRLINWLTTVNNIIYTTLT